jgi:hypothetical protein
MPIKIVPKTEEEKKEKREAEDARGRNKTRNPWNEKRRQG